MDTRRDRFSYWLPPRPGGGTCSQAAGLRLRHWRRRRSRNQPTPDSRRANWCCSTPGERARPGAAGASASVVLGVDTLVSLDGATLGKPRNLADAARHPGAAGRSHPPGLHRGQPRTGGRRTRIASFVEETRVTFRPLTAGRDRREYHRLIDPLDKAGSYAAQEHGERVIACGGWLLRPTSSACRWNDSPASWPASSASCRRYGSLPPKHRCSLPHTVETFRRRKSAAVREAEGLPDVGSSISCRFP